MSLFEAAMQEMQSNNIEELEQCIAWIEGQMKGQRSGQASNA